MKRAGFFCLCFAILSLHARAANVAFSFANATNYPGVLMPLRLTPTNVPVVFNGVLIQRDPLDFVCDSSGNIIVSNLAPVRYICQVGGGTSSVAVTTFQITVPDTNATLQLANVLSTPTNSPSAAVSSYSITAADATFVKQLDNGSDFSNARNVGANVGIKQMSPIGGGDGNADMLTATPAFEGQLGVSYFGSLSPLLWYASGTATGTNSWGRSLLIPGGISSVGLQWSTPPLANVGNSLMQMDFFFNGSPAGASRYMATNGNSQASANDSGLALWQMNPLTTGTPLWLPAAMTNGADGGGPTSGTNADGSPHYIPIGTNIDGIPVYASKFNGGSLVTIPDGVINRSYTNALSDSLNEGIAPFSFSLILPPSGMPFYVSGNYSWQGDVIGQHFFLGTDYRGALDSSKPLGTHFPFWQPGVYTFTNRHAIDSLFVDEAHGGVVCNATSFFGGMVITNRLTTGFKSPGIIDAGYDVNLNGTNISFNVPAVAGGVSAGVISWDALSSHRQGVLIQAGQYPKLAHGAGTPFTITRETAGSDLIVNSLGTVSDEFQIDSSGNVSVLNGGNLSVSGTSTASRNIFATNNAPTLGNTVTNISTWKGAGTTPTIYLTNLTGLSDAAMTLVVIPGGTSITTGTNICAINLGLNHTHTPAIWLTPYNLNEANLVRIYPEIQQSTSTSIVVAAGTTLVSGTVYMMGLGCIDNQ